MAPSQNPATDLGGADQGGGDSTGGVLPCPQSRTCIEIRKVSQQDRQRLSKPDGLTVTGEVMPIIPETGYANFTRGTGVMVVPLSPPNLRNARNPEPLPASSTIGDGVGLR